MSNDHSNPEEVAEFCRKVEQGIQKGVKASEMMDIMTVQHIIGKARGNGIVTLTDGETTIQCLINKPAREKPRRPKN